MTAARAGQLSDRVSNEGVVLVAEEAVANPGAEPFGPLVPWLIVLPDDLYASQPQGCFGAEANNGREKLRQGITPYSLHLLHHVVADVDSHRSRNVGRPQELSDARLGSLHQLITSAAWLAELPDDQRLGSRPRRSNG